MRRNDARHGSPAGYAKHVRDKEKVCGPCRAAKAEAAHVPFDPELEDTQVELTGGSWVNDRGIQRWQPYRTMRLRSTPAPFVEPEPVVAAVVIPEPEPVNPRDAIACRCGAKASEACRTKGGDRVRTHRSRWIARMCVGCNDPAPYRSRYCPPCRREAELAAKRVDYQRQRAIA